MATSPVTVNTHASVVVASNINRKSIRFQNTGNTNIYIKKNTYHDSIISHTDYEVLLTPATSPSEAGEAFETESIHSFSAISTCNGGILAIFETEFKSI